MTVPATPPPPEAWLGRFVGLVDVDPGEAQLLAHAANEDVLVLTGDKRALHAIVPHPDLVTRLQGKVALLEIVLHRICQRLGNVPVQQAIREGGVSDTMLQVCFWTDDTDPLQALASYVDDARRRLAPLRLWVPTDDKGKTDEVR